MLCQAYEWGHLIHEGARLTSNPWGVPLFSASFFVITGFKVLPSSDSRITAINLVIYTFMLLPMGLMPTIAGFAGKYALMASIFGGGLFFIQALSSWLRHLQELKEDT